MDPIFDVHMLNDEGKAKAQGIAEAFDKLLYGLNEIWVNSGHHPSIPLGGREQAITRTKLEEACFYAKKAMAIQKVNQV